MQLNKYPSIHTYIHLWVKEGENTSEHRQMKREAEEGDKVEVALGATIPSLGRFRAAALIGPTRGLSPSGVDCCVDRYIGLARSWRHIKLSLASALLLYFSGMCSMLLIFFLSFFCLFVVVFMLSLELCRCSSQFNKYTHNYRVCVDFSGSFYFFLICVPFLGS